MIMTLFAFHAIFADHCKRNMKTPGIPARFKTVWNADKMTEFIELRFFDAMSLDEIGKYYGRSTERMRQVEAKLLRILRHQRYRDSVKFWLLAK